MQSLDSILHSTRNDSVVATLVEVVGSGYRIPGARMIISRDGTHTGTISGGCLEKDIARGAFAFVENGPCLVLYDTRADEFRPNGLYGTGCEGLVYLLMEPSKTSALETIEVARTNRVPIVVSTIFRSADAKAIGERLTVTADDVQSTAGFPDALLGHVTSAVKSAIERTRSEVLIVRTTDFNWSLLIEFIAPRPRVVIVGDGEDAKTLAKLCNVIGWDVIIASRDPMRLVDINFCDTVVIDKSIAELGIDSFTAVVLMTHDFELDRDILPELFEQSPSYLGILGPKKRTASLLSDLIANGIDLDLDALPFRTPVGLDLGSDEPAHVALSVMAEICAVQNDRDGGMLGKSTKGIQKKLTTRVIDISDSPNDAP